MAGLLKADVAQLVEHVIGNDEVVGSIPTVGSKQIKSVLKRSLFLA